MTTRRLAAIAVASEAGVRRSAGVESEIAAAIDAIIAYNVFDPLMVMEDGPYGVIIRVVDQSLVFELYHVDTHQGLGTITLSARSLQRVIRDYFMICESHAKAIAGGNMMQVETIDMARRGLHDEGGMQLAALLHGKVSLDFATARRLFTLVCALQIGVNHAVLGLHH